MKKILSRVLIMVMLCSLMLSCFPVAASAATPTFTWTSNSSGSIKSEATDITDTSAYFPYYCKTSNVNTSNITEVGVVFTNVKTGVSGKRYEYPSFSGSYSYFYASTGYYGSGLTAGMQYSYYYYAVYGGTTYTSTTKTFYTTGSTTGTLAVYGYLDDTKYSSLSGFGTFDVYINGTLKSNDTTSYSATLDVGDTYEITDVRAAGLHTYNGLRSGYSYKGTISSGNSSVVALDFSSNQYTITLNPNGGTMPGGSSVSVTYGKSTNYNISSYTPSRLGYAFTGWYTTGNVQVYNAQGQCTNEGTYWDDDEWCGSSNVTLYAHWTNMTLTLPQKTVEIRSKAFEGVKAQVIIIPAGVKTIAADAFDGCPNLTTIVNYSGVTITPPSGVSVVTSMS